MLTLLIRYRAKVQSPIGGLCGCPMVSEIDVKHIIHASSRFRIGIDVVCPASGLWVFAEDVVVGPVRGHYFLLVPSHCSLNVSKSGFKGDRSAYVEGPSVVWLLGQLGAWLGRKPRRL